MKKQNIEIKIITKKKGKGRVSFNILSNLFSSIQNVFNELGDYFSGEEFRNRGPSKNKVTDLLELELTEVHHSNLTICAELPAYQETLTNEELLSDVVINNFDMIIDTVIHSEDIGKDVGKIIQDEKHKTKILKSVYDFWPRDSEYEYNITSGLNSTRFLKSERRKSLDKYLEGIKIEGEEELIGPLTSLSIIEPLTFYVGKKPKRKCEFTNEIEELSKKYIGKIVKIRGNPKYQTRGAEKIFENVHYIKPIETWDFENFHSDVDVIQLKNPIKANVDFIDKMIVIENEEFNILCISENWDDCLEQFNEFFIFLWENFAEEANDKLTKDGIILKEKLLNSVVKNN